ncbi:MAG: phytoene desaturase family protein [Chitinispirillaceae bacterium]|jgi:phytoene desaturase|nr:phytoene desaturase family protein [Chitinispirillaceae bacterium]
MSQKHIAIIGAGPGGLTTGMILASRGYKVSIYEREGVVGGRNAPIIMNGYTFDTGPTFLMMTFVLREMFAEAGRSLDDYCKIIPLDPMYKLSFTDCAVFPTPDKAKMKEQIARLFPGNEGGLDRFHAHEKIRYDKMYPCLKKDYSTFKEMFSAPLMKALPYLSLHRSLMGVLGDYFTQEKLRICFTFQAKYIGMSPWECPAAFAIMPYIEHSMGIDHVQGGLSKISDAMAKVIGELGGEIHLNSTVKRVTMSGRNATGIELASGETIAADAVVINADFGYAMQTLFDPGVIRKWAPEKLRKKKYSCSTFMLYLGVDKKYDEPHHNIIFANDYKENVKDIISRGRLSEDMSVYVRNASVTDPTLAPAGHSALYVLVPTVNTGSGVPWDAAAVKAYRDKVVARIMERTTMKDLDKHITCEKIITPAEWQDQRHLFLGATFNLGHTITQMLYLRPRNKFEEVGRCYLVGGGTHPGSGLPTIYESARISANLIGKYEK